jgi:hypothetical protein
MTLTLEPILSLIENLSLLANENLAISLLTMACAYCAMRLYYEFYVYNLPVHTKKMNAAPEIEDYLHPNCSPKHKKCAQLLIDLKSQLPPDTARKISKMSIARSHSSCQDKLPSMYVALIDQTNERYKIVLEEAFFDLYTVDEVNAMLGHEVSHVKLNHLTSTERIYSIMHDTSFYTFLGGGISTIGLTTLKMLHIFLLTLESLDIGKKNIRHWKTEKIFDYTEQLSSVFILFFLSTVLAKFLSLHFQKKESDADREALQLGVDAETLISAFKKTQTHFKQNQHSMFTKVLSIFETHPSTQDRIEALRIK